MKCREWKGKKNNMGYGISWCMGKTWLTHRLAWTLEYGRIPDEMIVMHICDNPICYELTHLKLGTMAENSQDMVKKGRFVNQQVKKTHCPAGHEYNDENTYLPPNRKERQCRECQRKHSLDYYYRKQH